MSLPRLITFYEKILNSLGCTIDKDTREVFLSYEGEDTPVYVKRKRLIAIDRKIIKDGIDNDTHVAFHPLSESATAGMSDVHQWLLLAINLRLNTYMVTVASRIATIASTPELLASMQPKEVAQYQALTAVNKDLPSSVSTIAEQMDVTDKSRSFVHVRCKKAGTLNGKSFGRVTYVTFPIISELESGLSDGKVFGKTIRKKDIKSLITIFNDIILNDRTEITDFSSGNTTVTAPYLCSMLNAYNNVLVRFNSLQRSQGDTLKSVGLPADISWYPDVSNFQELQKLVPQLEGNVGTVNGVQDRTQKTITKNHYENTDGEVIDNSGINKAIETVNTPVAYSSNPFRAVPLKDGMGVTITPSTVVSNNPLVATSTVAPVNVNDMTVEQYMIHKTQQDVLNGYGNTQSQQVPLRGRDAYMQNKQMETLGYGTSYNPNVNTGYNAYDVQQPQAGAQLMNINGQLVQVIPVQQQQIQTVQPVASRSLSFKDFAR